MCRPRRVTTNDLDDKNVCTYMEALKATRDKLNEVIDVINRSNIVPTFHYNVSFEATSTLISFDIYSHKDLTFDDDDILDFLEKLDENFWCSCNGVYSSNLIYKLYYDKDDEMFTLTDSYGTDSDIAISSITNSLIIKREV